MNWFTSLLKTFAKGTTALAPNCRQASRLQAVALVCELTFFQRVGLRIHLWLCKWCRRYGKQIRFLGDGAHEHPAELAEPVRQKLAGTTRERMKQRLRAEEE